MTRLSYDPQTGRITPFMSDVEALPAGTTTNGKTFAPSALNAMGVSLRPLRAGDYEYVRYAETSTGEMLARWRFHGATPSAEDWMRQTFTGTLANFLVFTGDESTPPLGIVTAYDPRFDHGHARIAAARFKNERSERDDPSPVMIVGVGLLIRHLFASWNLRKLYMDVPEFNLAQFDRRLSEYFREEGRLRGHIFHSGSYWDQLTFALYRETWDEVQDQLLLPGRA